MSLTQKGLQAVRSRIAEAARAAGRSAGAIELVAVTKSVPAVTVVEACRLGQHAFGESYAQEAVGKIAQVRATLEAAAQTRALAPQWHFIGPIQSNKTRVLAESFDWVQSIDRLKVAQRLSDQRPVGRPPLQVCVQVNISAEPTKGGVSPHEVASLVASVAVLPRLRLRGLMTIPEPTPDTVQQRRQFRRLRELLDALNSAGAGLDTLSMGMSDDLESAIAEGATMVRVGTAIFGLRR